jgi:hypothetical protein
VYLSQILIRGFKLNEEPQTMELIADLYSTLEAELYQETYLPTFVAALQQRLRRKKADEAQQKARDIKAMHKLDSFTEPGPLMVRPGDVRPPKKSG